MCFPNKIEKNKRKRTIVEPCCTLHKRINAVRVKELYAKLYPPTSSRDALQLDFNKSLRILLRYYVQ